MKKYVRLNSVPGLEVATLDAITKEYGSIFKVVQIHNVAYPNSDGYTTHAAVRAREGCYPVELVQVMAKNGENKGTIVSGSTTVISWSHDSAGVTSARKRGYTIAFIANVLKLGVSCVRRISG